MSALARSLAVLMLTAVACSRQDPTPSAGPAVTVFVPPPPSSTPSTPPTAPPASTSTLQNLHPLDAPPTSETWGAPPSNFSPGLSGSAVMKFVDAKRPTLNATCAPDPCRAATATLTIGVDPSGRVTSATSSGDAAVGACLVRLAKAWKLPASPGGGTFVIPFIFAC
jgi:TonB family protein